MIICMFFIGSQSDANAKHDKLQKTFLFTLASPPQYFVWKTPSFQTAIELDIRGAECVY